LPGHIGVDFLKTNGSSHFLHMLMYSIPQHIGVA
jgi:hypothetical protein